MKRGRSTSKPTKAEEAYIVAVKSGPCVACEVLRQTDVLSGCDGEGCDFHHLLSGGRRRGHMFGIGLDPWHHRAVPLPGMTAAQMRTLFGPSLMDGSKAFAAVFGTDDELLDRQRRYLEGV